MSDQVSQQIKQLSICGRDDSPIVYLQIGDRPVRQFAVRGGEWIIVQHGEVVTDVLDEPGVPIEEALEKRKATPIADGGEIND